MARNSARVTTSLVSKWTPQTELDLDRACLEMATDIHRGASILAPKATRALVKSGRIRREGQAHYVVSFGDARVPYARIQHEGGVITPKNGKFLAWETDNGTWAFAKSVTIKGTKYLEQSGDSVARGSITKYMRSV